MAGQGSARVTLREIDLSQVKNPQQLPQGVPAAVVGPARKGPAFVPRTFANMQQFNEVFGSMLEVGRESNSNQFGPLALNEWMKSAKAGTYIRVLGVGDGKPSSAGKVTDAGFVVGEKQLQDQDSGVAKVGDNPHAAITDSTAALALGRTHMLGCFMKDSTGSNYLKDAGMESEGAAASLVIEFGSQPTAGDTIVLDAVDTNGALNGDYTFEFYANGGAGAGTADVDVEIGADAVETLANLKAAIQNVATPFGAGQPHEVVVSAVEDVNGADNDDLARITLTSKFPAALDATNDCVIKFNLNPAVGDDLKVKVGDKTASVTDATFAYGMEGGTTAKTEITITAKPADNSTLAIHGLQIDNIGGALSGALELVTYKFDDATIAAGNGGAADGTDGVADRYNVTGANAVTIYSGGSLNNTLSNLKAAIDRTAVAAFDLQHRGLFSTSLSSDDLTLTINQIIKGAFGNASDTGTDYTFDDANITLGGATGLSIKAANSNDGDQDVLLTVNADSGFFFGGTDGNSVSFTMALSGQPNDNDFLRLRMLDSTDDEAIVFENFVFETFDNKSGENGVNQGTPGTAGGPTLVGRNPTDNFITVLIGDDLQETLYNLKNAIRSSSTDNTKTDLRAIVDDATNSITVTLYDITGGDNDDHKSARLLLNNVMNISDVATFSNPAGESLKGNYGEKTENFSGGGGAAVPVIRGVLMTPQGVRAALDVNNNLAQFVSTADANTAQIRSVAHGKTFGLAAGTHLTGYVVGEVDSSQGFKLILNGYSNEENPAVLNCSFNPSSASYFAKVLNTDPTKIEELGHYLYANWDIDPLVAAPSNVGLRHAGGQLSGDYANMKGFLAAGAAGRNNSAAGKPNYEEFSNRYATAKTPWIVSQFYGAGADDAARPATASAGQALNLFRLHSLDDGAISNGQYRLLVSNLRYGGLNDYGSFDLTLESFGKDPIKGIPLVTWKNANLDVNSRNFIGRLVGDKNMYYDFESDVSKQRLKEDGQYTVKNDFVRIELSDALKQGQVPITALPAGFQGHSYLSTKSNGNFIELDIAEASRVFTSAANTVTETLSQAQVLPLDYVTSINRVIGSATLEADDDLAWGVKFGIRENPHEDNSANNKGHKELVEQVFNTSISSWSKFFPSIGSNPAWIVDGDSADENQNSFFSLEKISVPSGSLSSDEIASWNGAVYKRLSTDTPAGRFVTISKDALGKNAKYLKFRCMFQGGFDGVNIFDEEKSEFTGTASLREGEDETNTQKFTGPTIMSYQRAIDVLSDKSATEFQLLAIPGQRTARITDYAITACEDRFDAMLVMDLVEKDSLGGIIEESTQKPHVRNTISLFAGRILDTSFAAVYFPDVVMQRPSDNAPIVVPPSVGMLGVMSRNDSIADPWFAPAGLNRGRLSAVDSRVQMNRDLLDELYDADINPIYVPAGRSGEVYAFGQKTLLQDQSALDRINVRRLLIDLRRKVKKVGEKLLFEPNRASTLSRFSSLVEPIMANVQQRRGVTRYKVQIDASTTTQNDIENNTIRGKIYLQPTKSVEFISLDFVVANTIQ
jgi:hypothetical protein